MATVGSSRFQWVEASRVDTRRTSSWSKPPLYELVGPVAQEQPVQDRVRALVCDPHLALVGDPNDEVRRGCFVHDHIGNAHVAGQRPDLRLEEGRPTG